MPAGENTVLTADLLRVRRQKQTLLPRYLKAAERTRLKPAAEQLIAVVAQSLGEPRHQLEKKLSEVEVRASDVPIVAGLRKLLLDRCELSTPSGWDAVAARDTIFRLATENRKALGPTERFDRDALLTEAAATLQATPEELSTRLYADLRHNEVLNRFRKLRAPELLNRYDVALAQGVLLRATRVVIELTGETPGRIRQLFRAARFHGLLHRVTRLAKRDYRIELDGPLSLFSAVQKYGLKLALFLPDILRCKKWQLTAEVLWGKQKLACNFALSAADGLTSKMKAPKGVAPQLAKFVTGFEKLKSPWTLTLNDEIFALPGESVCVPDLVFSNTETGEVVYLEAFGFWSRKAVWQRIETLEKGFPARLILAVGKQLRVSQEMLEDNELGELYVYKGTMRPRVVLARLEG